MVYQRVETFSASILNKMTPITNQQKKNDHQKINGECEMVRRINTIYDVVGSTIGGDSDDCRGKCAGNRLLWSFFQLSLIE